MDIFNKDLVFLFLEKIYRHCCKSFPITANLKTDDNIYINLLNLLEKKNGECYMAKPYGETSKGINKLFSRAAADLPQRKFLILLSILLLVMFASLTVYVSDSVAQEMAKPVADFTAGTFYDNQEGILLYRLLKPMTDNAQGASKYPLVLFLHGSGERGADNIKQLKYIGQIFEQSVFRQNYPCFVVAPQCPQDQNWVYKESYSGTVPESPEPAKPLWQTVELLRELQNEFPIDPGRIYAIGLSSGGSGVWDLIARYPQMFAAAAPFCGCGDDQKAYLMVSVPLWAFHGKLDPVVSPNTTRMMIQAIRKAGGNPKYTEYPNLFHNTWNKTFHDPQFFQWLFAQKQNVK